MVGELINFSVAGRSLAGGCGEHTCEAPAPLAPRDALHRGADRVFQTILNGRPEAEFGGLQAKGPSSSGLDDETTVARARDVDLNYELSAPERRRLAVMVVAEKGDADWALYWAR